MKPVLCILAHPDDEAFGPAGTIAQLSSEREVYVICVTDGGAGEIEEGLRLRSGNKSLAEVRKEELGESAKVLGMKEIFFLDYADGSLSNNLYHEIAEKIQEKIDEIQPEILMTFEPRGMTGHLDHIAVSMIASYVFEKSPEVSELWQYCLNEEQREAFGSYYIYFPQGYRKEEITQSVDVSDVWDKKLEAIHKHQSQKQDIEAFLRQFENLPKIESFLIHKKD